MWAVLNPASAGLAPSLRRGGVLWWTEGTASFGAAVRKFGHEQAKSLYTTRPRDLCMIEERLGGYGQRYAPYRSWNEQRIAGLLDKYRLPFIYEKPTAVLDNNQVRLWYPDFTLAYGLIIEYFGIQGDAGYDSRTRHKLGVYQQNQIEVLPLYHRDMGPGWDGRLIDRVDKVLENRVSQYRTATRCSYAPPRLSQPYR